LLIVGEESRHVKQVPGRRPFARGRSTTETVDCIDFSDWIDIT
jgi:hypothetical protein